MTDIRPSICVVVYGCDDDAMRETIDSLGAQAPGRVHVLRVPSPNKSRAAALNTAVAKADAPYVALVAAGTRWPRDFAERQQQFLDDRPDCAAVFAVAGPTGSAGTLTLRALIDHSAPPLGAALIRREAMDAAGAFDEGIREGFDLDLWLRLARRGTTLWVRELPFPDESIQPPARQSAVERLECTLSVLERFASRHLLDAPTRTAIRVRIMRLIDRLEVEQAKCRIIEGNFHAARFHLASARTPSWKVRATLIVLKLTPRLVRAVYRTVPALATFL